MKYTGAQVTQSSYMTLIPNNYRIMIDALKVLLVHCTFLLLHSSIEMFYYSDYATHIYHFINEFHGMCAILLSLIYLSYLLIMLKNAVIF